MLLSILIPVYNERAVVERSLSLVLSAPLPENMERELIIVDDCSTDGTWAILERLAESEPRIRLYRHEVNQGKGAAVRTAITKASGDFTLVQDADLEYDPGEYPVLLRPLLDGRADAVFGSRYMAGVQTRVLPFWHSMINKHLTLLSNIFSNIKLTDMETCYKVFRTDLLKSIPIRSNRFGFEPEITMKSAKRKLRIYEVPISYHGRTYEEGKKIGWKDGLKALGVILHFWLVDDLYVQPYGRAFLNNLSGTPQYLSWITRIARPYLGDVVLELGAGIGNLTGRLMARRQLYAAAENDPLYLHSLNNRFLRTPNVRVVKLNPADPAGYSQFDRGFDTILCMNVLEYLDNPERAVASAAKLLEPGGRFVVLVPQGKTLYSSLDRTLGHKRRFAREDIEEMLANQGLTVEKSHQLAKIGALAWWLFGKMGRQKQISKLWLKLFDKTVWVWRRVDFLLPWNGLSLVLVARKKS
ncbi:MAG: Undecaprenyl-phosphate 4-deoxy-4-formamido-L-arabinose transferase [Bryobacteraceae bacterium]|nr:Undecaprenyl-phosphate 4-deoxy-4-formamido-L-arabinose transferase [Bryobacteraceae bacterium]